MVGGVQIGHWPRTRGKGEYSHPATAKVGDGAHNHALRVEGLVCLHGRIPHAVRGAADD